MKFELRLFDEELLRFEASPREADPGYRITWVAPGKEHLLPHGFSPTAQGLSEWIRRRTIPKNRAFVSTLLARYGLSPNRPMAVIALCKGLSLNDSYWVTEEGDDSTFAKVNLFDNPMSQLLAQVAFTGCGSSQLPRLAPSPEFTTNGMLPKCWRRIGGTVFLYKGGSSGFANAGFEPYSEYYAAEVAGSMGLSHADYQLHRWKGVLCSSCELFTSKELSYVPMLAAVSESGFEGVRALCASLGPQYEQALSDMLAFDAVICNTDRHLGNFGFLVESRTNRIAAPAPLFDHGDSLFHHAYGDDWSSPEALAAYAAAQAPCLYADFFDTARELMTKETRGKVRGLLEFSFTRGPKKGFPKRRLELIEGQIRERSRQLLA